MNRGKPLLEYAGIDGRRVVAIPQDAVRLGVDIEGDLVYGAVAHGHAERIRMGAAKGVPVVRAPPVAVSTLYPSVQSFARYGQDAEAWSAGGAVVVE